MQFKVPQNIDLEDRLVGPLTLIQFLYLLFGGIFIYLLITALGFSFLFWILAIPIGLLSLGLAFVKIQDQPLSHFIKAGLVYLGRPKQRVWQRQGEFRPVLKEGPKKKQEVIEAPKRDLSKSELENLANILDTQAPSVEEQKNLGSVSAKFEQLLNEKPGQKKENTNQDKENDKT
jgi:hypothetical protein